MQMGQSVAVRADRLAKRYGKVQALDDFALEVPTGSVCGLLGPNGAGKTTAVRIFTTLVRPDGGHAEVAGFDVVRQADHVRSRIGLVGQQAAIDEELSGRQNLEMFGRLFHLRGDDARRRAGELLERFELSDTGDKAVKRFSGGMRRRLDLATGLILTPAVLFLDEPTTGLDPRGRNEVWEAIRSLVREGTTVVLTTQYLDEADQLADRICVIDGGRVIAEGTPTELKGRVGGERLEVIVRRTAALEDAVRLLARETGVPPDVDRDQRRVSAPIQQRLTVLVEALRAFEEAEIEVEDIALRKPTLDEAFLHLTGHRADEDKETAA